MILDTQVNQIGGRTKLFGTPVGAKSQKDCVLLNEYHDPYYYSKEYVDPHKEKQVKNCVERKLKFLSTGKLERVYQVFTYYSSSVSKLSSDADYENHILYQNRFIIDEGIDQDDVAPTVLTFDIECLGDDEFSFPTPSKNPIFSIAARYEDDEVKVFMDEDEETVLLEFIDYLQKCDPDVVCGYNSNNFDIRYTMSRCDKLNTVEPFARFGNTYARERVDSRTGKKNIRWFMPGRVNFDVILAVFADQSLNAQTKGRGLKAVSKYFYEKGDIDHAPIELEESIYSLWNQGEEGRELLKEYNARDVLCTHDICRKIYLPAIIELSKILECDLQAACNYTQYWLSEIVLGKKYREENILCDINNDERHANVFSKVMKGTGKIQGALSGIKRRGFFWNPFKLDFKGYYPSICRKYNISPENTELSKILEYNENGYKQWETDQYYFFTIPDSNCKCNFVIKIDKSKRGYLPQIQDDLADLRDTIKRDKTKGTKSRDWAIKVVMNALIGINALPYTSRGSILCSILVLGIARYYTRRSLEISEEMGANVCNWDTDGIIVSDFYDVDKLSTAIKEDSGLIIEHEASYDWIMVYKPKCYVVKYKGEKIIHGIALKGKDKPNLCDKLMDELIDLLVDHYGDDRIIIHLMRFLLDIDFLDDMRFISNDYMINKTLQQEPENYIANTPQKRVALEMLRRGSTISAGDELTYFWGLYADENKNYTVADSGNKRKSDAMPMLSEDWKLLSFELTDLNNQIDTISKNRRMKGRWMSFYKEISPYLKDKDYSELAQEIGDQEWSATYYYYNKMYSKMNMLKSFKLKKNTKPPAAFFEQFYDYLVSYYPNEDEFAKFFSELCGISSIDIEDSDLVDESLATMEEAKQDIIYNLDEKYNLDWYSDRYNVDALYLSVTKYAKLTADILVRICAAYFGLVEEGKKDIKLNEMGRRIKDLFLRKEKVRGYSIPVNEIVRRKLINWKDEHGIEPQEKELQTTLEV